MKEITRLFVLQATKAVRRPGNKAKLIENTRCSFAGRAWRCGDGTRGEGVRGREGVLGRKIWCCYMHTRLCHASLQFLLALGLPGTVVPGDLRVLRSGRHIPTEYWGSPGVPRENFFFLSSKEHSNAKKYVRGIVQVTKNCFEALVYMYILISA